MYSRRPPPSPRHLRRVHITVPPRSRQCMCFYVCRLCLVDGGKMLQDKWWKRYGLVFDQWWWIFSKISNKSYLCCLFLPTYIRQHYSKVDVFLIRFINRIYEMYICYVLWLLRSFYDMGVTLILLAYQPGLDWVNQWNKVNAIFRLNILLYAFTNGFFYRFIPWHLM